MMVVQEEGVLKGQELENALSEADYTKAIQIAFELRRPRKLFELFSELSRLVIVYFCISVPLGISELCSLQEEGGSKPDRKSPSCPWQGRISSTA